MAIQKPYEDIEAEVEEFNRMLVEKPFHVQAEVFFVEELTPEMERANDCNSYPLIKARIVRIFRGEGLQIGDEVSFRLWASYEGICGGESPADYRELKETKYFELLLEDFHIEKFFNGYRLDLSCQRKIDEPTDNPVIAKLSPPEKEENFIPNPFQVSPKMRCRRCGAEFPQYSKYCGYCGITL